MAEAYKSLGQAAPAAATLTTLYTVPGATSTVISSVVVCNTASYAATFRISHALAAAADTLKQYLFYDVSVPGNTSYVATLGATLATTDLLRCYSSNGNLSFNAYGTEIT